jgi:hypothetical protein
MHIFARKIKTFPSSPLTELTMLGDRKVLNELRLAVSPVIDGELLPKSPKELRAESPVKRVICGQSRHEGLLFCKFHPSSNIIN